jgi:uncharacterized protein (DUF697 family)
MIESEKGIHTSIKKEELLSKLEAFSIFRAIKAANPKIKQDIKKLRVDILRGLSRHDRKSGIWFLTLFKKVIDLRSKTISLESLYAAYKTEDKEVIAKKLIAHYANYGIAVGATLGSAGGALGFITASYATFGEIACITYFQLSLLYDLSVLYERPIDKINNLEVYRLLQSAFSLTERDLLDNKVDELVDKGTRLIEEKLQRGDSQKHLHGLLKNIGAFIVHKAAKNLMAKMIPIVGLISGAIVCITEDFCLVRELGKRTLNYYSFQQKM